MVEKTKKNGFTVAEMMIALCIIGVICAICIPAMRFYTPDYQKAMFKKAYAITEDTISKMINDNRFYSIDDEGFAYLKDFRVDDKCFGSETEDDGSCGDPTPETKFRDVFRYYLDEVENVGCEDATDCETFKTNDNIIWNIPDDDFSDGGVIILLYLRDNDLNNNSEAFQINISKNGRITVPDCDNPDLKRCKEVEMLKSKNIMKD